MQLGWIDFSRSERNKILQTLKQLEEAASLDELGIGVIRDGYADILFPGISTLQTRAKYFVLLPYIFQKAEHETWGRSGDILPWIHKQEDALVPVLINNSADKSRIIGLRSYRQGKTVKVKPSSIYWNGMRTYEILRDENLSIGNVCNIIYGKSIRKRALTIKTEGKRIGSEFSRRENAPLGCRTLHPVPDNGFDDETAGNENMPLFSPITPDYSFMTEAAMELTNDEAVFLFQKITRARASRDSLLSYMLREKVIAPSLFELDINPLPEHLAEAVLLARGFADFIYGAHLRYNVIFSNYEDIEMEYEFQNWLDLFDFDGFNLPAVFSKVNSNQATNAFLKSLCDAAIRRDIDAIDSLIVNRERAIKHDRAKLLKPQEYRYDIDNPVHYFKLSYRYDTAIRIISEILTGMEG